jgi:DNA polymerase III epsilon subunit-like protein
MQTTGFIQRNRQMEKDKILVLDTETTGFLPDAEVLQVSILDGNGTVRMNEYFRPDHTSAWPGAMAVNHITLAMVADKPSIGERKEEISHLLRHAEAVVGYNIFFDLKMLRQNGIFVPGRSHLRAIDIMGPFSDKYGEEKDLPLNKYGHYKYQKLITCAAYYGYDGGGWHDSLADTKATLFCFWKMVEDGTVKI